MEHQETLLIIDMQPFVFYGAVLQETVNQVVEEVHEARRKQMPIIVLEFTGLIDCDICEVCEGYSCNDCTEDTAYEILEALDGYARYTVCKKRLNDGSDQALFAAESLKIDSKYWRVCGVNSDYCVLETVQGLLNEGQQVTVVKKACNSDQSNNPWLSYEHTQETNSKKFQLV